MNGRGKLRKKELSFFNRNSWPTLLVHMERGRKQPMRTGLCKRFLVRGNGGCVCGTDHHSIGVRFADVYGVSGIFCHIVCADLRVIRGAADRSKPCASFFFINFSIFMEKMAGFIKLYFPVFLLGAIFGKVVEMAGLAASIAKTIVRLVGAKRAILAIVLMGAVLTYSGVSLFVVVFAVYPFAKNMFQEANIPKRLIPGTIALGAFTFTMDALPGTPQIQNVIPTSFFKTDIYAAPWLGLMGAVIVLAAGMLYFESRRKKAQASGEGYGGFDSQNAPAPESIESAAEPDKSPIRHALAFVPLILVGAVNKYFTIYLPKWYPNGFDFSSIGLKEFGRLDISSAAAIWSVEIALVIGIITTILFDWRSVFAQMKEGLNEGIGGALLASMNTGAEYGFGGIIAALPGFHKLSSGISHTFTDPLVNGAVTTTALAGITGSASGGMGIALSAMSEQYLQAIQAYNARGDASGHFNGIRRDGHTAA